MGNALSTWLGRMRSAGPHVDRVLQLDGQLLQAEVESMLKHQFGRVLMHVSPEITEVFAPEISAVFSALVFGSSVLLHKATFADQMLCLTYAVADFQARHLSLPSSRRLLTFGCLTIVVPYLCRRLPPLVDSAREIGRCWSLAQLLHFLVFLRSAAYRGIPERVCKLRLLPSSEQALLRMPNYEFMNRQIIWATVSDFLGTFLPAIRWPLIVMHRWLVYLVQRGIQWLRRALDRCHRRGPDQEQRRIGTDQAPTRPRARQDDSPPPCAVCGAERSRTPTTARCGHVFCYYCLAQNAAEDAGHLCPVCHSFAEPSARWMPQPRPTSA